MLRPLVVSVFTSILILLSVVMLRSEELRFPGNNKGYEPEQPLPFSHKLHAGDLKVSCVLCHSSSLRSRFAGVPPLDVCMNCHQYITAPEADIAKEDEDSFLEDREPRLIVAPGIHQIYDALGLNDLREPDATKTPQGIEWLRVHRLPDFAFFDHAAHVSAGEDCTSCHGPVEEMERVRQVYDFTMGWCIECHQKRNTEFAADGNKNRAPMDCGACHH